MSAELLRRAADRIEELAAAATEPAWGMGTYEDDQGGTRGFVGGDTTTAGGFIADVPSAVNARWIAALGPQVAAPLAAWLRAEADCQEATGAAQQHLPELIGALAESRTGQSAPRTELRVSISTSAEAVAFACALLGEAAS